MFSLSQWAPQNRKQGKGWNSTQEIARRQEGARTCGQFGTFWDKRLVLYRNEEDHILRLRQSLSEAERDHYLSHYNTF